jgi:hypothetical protein
MILRFHFTICLIAVVFLFCNSAHAQVSNALTAKENRDGWMLLFDGKDLKGWHAYHEKAIGNVWHVSEGNIFAE